MTLPGQRDVGTLGELKLEEWCAQIGITANRVQRDRTGWDNLLEFPLLPHIQPPSNIPLDICLQPLQCFVQVKSTDDRCGRWSVKMDNWTRFIKSPIPAFFLVFEYDGKNLCQRAYLVHVDKIYIKKVLEKLRKISSKNKKLLHKKKITV